MHKLSGQGVRIAFRKGLLYEVLSLNAVATSCMALIDLIQIELDACLS